MLREGLGEEVEKEMALSPPFQTPTQTLIPSSPPPTTTGDRHEPPLLAVGPLHGEEQFNRSGIFKTYLEDSIEKEASNPSFTVFFFEVIVILILLLVSLSLSLHLF